MRWKEQNGKAMLSETRGMKKTDNPCKIILNSCGIILVSRSLSFEVWEVEQFQWEIHPQRLYSPPDGVTGLGALLFQFSISHGIPVSWQHLCLISVTQVVVWDLGPSTNSSNNAEAYSGDILQIPSAVRGQCWLGCQSSGSVVTRSLTPNYSAVLVVPHCYHSISDTNSVPWSEPPFVTVITSLSSSHLWAVVSSGSSQLSKTALVPSSCQQSCRAAVYPRYVCGF